MYVAILFFMLGFRPDLCVRCWYGGEWDVTCTYCKGEDFSLLGQFCSTVLPERRHIVRILRSSHLSLSPVNLHVHTTYVCQ